MVSYFCQHPLVSPPTMSQLSPRVGPNDNPRRRDMNMTQLHLSPPRPHFP